MNIKGREISVMNAMNAGMERAARSFSIMLKSPVKTNPSQILSLEHNNNFSRLKQNETDLYLLVTQIIGDVNGKSYLIFSQKESLAILEHLKKENPTMTDNLLEAFLMEIDNIVSAAVISELSDRLKGEIYGDVPHLMRVQGEKLYDIMASDKDPRDTGDLVVNTGFIIEKCPDVHPQFIWKISPALLDLLPAHLSTVQNR